MDELKPDHAQTDPAEQRMQELIDQWKAAGDQREIFLSCYRLMTINMLAAIDQQVFHDSAWVNQLLHRFAGYYFTALEAYEADKDHPADMDYPADIEHPADTEQPRLLSPAPPVWRLAFEAAHHPGTLALQNLLLGVNAHINYDLVLALMEILEPEWSSLTEEQRALRYEDHCHVNRVIGQTIDAVQDDVLDPEMPVMELIDKLMGPVDEMMISHLLTHWRESVWHHALHLLETSEPDERANRIKHIEKEVLELGEIIQLHGFKA